MATATCGSSRSRPRPDRPPQVPARRSEGEVGGAMDVDEQAFVWALSHHRHDPAGWAAVRWIDQRVGRDGRPVDLTDVSPRPTLAVSGLLATSARGHAEEMAVHDYFGYES